jgi:hypothetical protein
MTMNPDDIINGDLSNQSFSLDPGIIQMYVLRNTIEIKIRLQSIQKKQFEIAELVSTSMINDKKVHDELHILNEAILELTEKELNECIAHAADASKE